MSEDKFTQIEWLEMFDTLRSIHRINILIYLNNEGPKSVPQISERLYDLFPRYTRLKYTSQSWIDVYINPLLTKGLIDYADRPDYKLFEITQKAKDVLEILECRGIFALKE